MRATIETSEVNGCSMGGCACLSLEEANFLTLLRNLSDHDRTFILSATEALVRVPAPTRSYICEVRKIEEG